MIVRIPTKYMTYVVLITTYAFYFLLILQLHVQAINNNVEKILPTLKSEVMDRTWL